MRHLILFLLALCESQMQGAQSIVFSGSQGVSATLPNAAPFNVIGSCRWEWRMHNFVLGPPAQEEIFTTSTGLLVYIPAGSSSLAVTDFGAAAAPTISISLAGRTDVLVRLNRDQVARKTRLEIWDADGTNYMEGASYQTDTGNKNMSGPFTIGYTGTSAWLTGRLAYFRWYGSSIEMRARPPSNVAGGDLLDYEFEGNGTDGSGHANLTTSGSPGYTASPAVAQLPTPCNGAYDCTVRAGNDFQFDGSGNAADAYFWQQIGGPALVTWSSRTAAKPIVSGAGAFGTYTFLLQTVTTGLSNALIFKVGAVATDSNGVVIIPDGLNSEKINFLLGPLLRNGVSEWTFYDYMRSRKGRQWGAGYAAQIAAALDTPATGIITATQGSTTITGGGTFFPFDSACNGSDVLLIYYPLGNGQFGRTFHAIASCQSNTSLTLATAYVQATSNGLFYQILSPAMQTEWGEINYYDSVLVQYENYFRTGIDDYLTYARTLAAGWWRYWPIDEGRRPVELGLPPREQSMKGLMLYALDNGPANELWQWIDATVDWHLNNWIEQRGSDNGYSSPYFGIRDAAYAYMFAADLAKVHPVQATRDSYLARVITEVANYWEPMQCRATHTPPRCTSPEGPFRSGDFGFGSWNGFAEQPFHSGIAMEALIDAYNVTGDNRVLSIIEKWVNNMLTGNSGPPGFLPGWQTQASGFDPSITCRRIFYSWYANPSELQVDENGTQGYGCIDPSGLSDGRAVNNEVIAAFGFQFAISGDPKFRTRGDDIFSATFARDAGAGADGYFGRMDLNQKQYGQSFRSTGTYMANRTGLIVAVDYPLVIGFNMSSVPNAVQVRATLRKPNGSMAQSVCNSSPCTVQANRIEGNHSLILEYLSTTGNVLATSERTLAVVAP